LFSASRNHPVSEARREMEQEKSGVDTTAQVYGVSEVRLLSPHAKRGGFLEVVADGLRTAGGGVENECEEEEEQMMEEEGE